MSDELTMPGCPELLANGVHANLHWSVQRIPGEPGVLVSVQGFAGPRWVFQQVQLPEASPASVRRLIDALLAEPVKPKRRRT